MQSDNAIRRASEDLFDRKDFARRIADVIANREDKGSLVIGIHAPWGDGKTSVLNMVEEFLERNLHKKGKTLINGHIVLHKFNPWRYGDEDSLLRSYFFGLADVIDGRIQKKGEKLAELLKQYSWVTASFDAVKISAFGLVDLNLDSEKILTKISEAKANTSAELLKTRIEAILEDTD